MHAPRTRDGKLFAIERGAIRGDDTVRALNAVARMEHIHDRDKGYAEIAEEMAWWEPVESVLRVIALIADPHVHDMTLVRLAQNTLEQKDQDGARSYLSHMRDHAMREQTIRRMGLEVA
jgi:hypothetical protein